MEFAFIVNVALPVVAVNGFMVNQLAVVFAVHVVFDVTEIATGLVLFFVKLAVFAANIKMVSPAACVTVIFCEETPFAVTVTVAIRGIIVGLLVFAVIFKTASPVVAIAGFNVNQLAVVFAVHVVFDLTEIKVVLAAVFAILTELDANVTTGVPAA